MHVASAVDSIRIWIASGFNWDSRSGFGIRMLLRIQEEQDGLRKREKKIIFLIAGWKE
jgi:hypothetical protein